MSLACIGLGLETFPGLKVIGGEFPGGLTGHCSGAGLIPGLETPSNITWEMIINANSWATF